MGITEIEGVHIYGKYYNYGRMGPTTVKKEFYFKHKTVLEAAPITGEWLGKKFNKTFPNVKFTFKKMFLELSNEDLLQIASLLGINYIKKLCDSSNEELNWLRKHVRDIIENIE